MTSRCPPLALLSEGSYHGIGHLHHCRGMTESAAILTARLPWHDGAAEQLVTWMLQVGAA